MQTHRKYYCIELLYTITIDHLHCSNDMSNQNIEKTVYNHDLQSLAYWDIHFVKFIYNIHSIVEIIQYQCQQVKHTCDALAKCFNAKSKTTS